MFMQKKLQNYSLVLLCLTLFGGLLLGVFNHEKLASSEKAEASGLQLVYLPITKNGNPIKTLFGVEMNPITDAQGLTKMSLAGASWVRRNGILWSAVEPIQGGGYDWSGLALLEADFLRARANQLEVVAIVRGLPEWARMPPYNYACGPINPTALPAFGDFLYALVQRYSGAPYYVKYWEIWNEPDVDPIKFPDGNEPYGCMGDLADTFYYGGQSYATILQTVYPRVKAANPEAKVVVGGLLMDCDPVSDPVGCVSSRYLEGILVAGGKDYFDGVSFHAYDFFSLEKLYPNGIYGNEGWNSGGSQNSLKPVIVAKVQYIKYLFGLYDVQGKFLMNTETALLCGGTFDPPGGLGCETTLDSPFEKLKAAYVAQTYAAALAEGLLANIWYSPKGWRNSGLFFQDFSPRPAYDAYALAHDTLESAIFIREIHEFEADMVFGYEFQVAQKTIWVLWTLDGNSHAITLSQTPLAVWDEVGVPVAFGPNTLTVSGLKTYYVDWAP